MDYRVWMRAAGPTLAVLGALVGFAVQGAEGAVIWLVVAYFVGKSVESLLLTMRGGPAH